MSDKTGIQWTDATWNPLRGCTRVSEGCRNCYAERVAARFSGPGQPYDGLATRSPARWTGVVRLVEEHMTDPLRWTRPRRIFVNSMSDLFHDAVPDEWIDRILGVAALCQSMPDAGQVIDQHTFQILTKRPDRMAKYFAGGARVRVWERASEIMLDASVWKARGIWTGGTPKRKALRDWPLPNVWLGVSVEGPDHRDRIDVLRNTPAALRFVSFEPLLADLRDFRMDGIAWAIFGGESGSGARPCDINWIRSGIATCRHYGTACFVKQLGAVVVQTATEWREGLSPEREWPFPQVIEAEPCGGPNDDWPGMVRFGSRGGEWMHVLGLRDRKGGDMAEWPEDLRVREFPQVGGAS